MQIKVKFTLSDLIRMTVDDTDDSKDPRNNIGRYVKALTDAGMLIEMPRRAMPTSLTSNGEKRWMLIRDLGRMAPIARTSGGIYDPNSGQTILPAGVTESEGIHVK